MNFTSFFPYFSMWLVQNFESHEYLAFVTCMTFLLDTAYSMNERYFRSELTHNSSLQLKQEGFNFSKNFICKLFLSHRYSCDIKQYVHNLLTVLVKIILFKIMSYRDNI